MGYSGNKSSEGFDNSLGLMVHFKGKPRVKLSSLVLGKPEDSHGT